MNSVCVCFNSRSVLKKLIISAALTLGGLASVSAHALSVDCSGALFDPKDTTKPISRSRTITLTLNEQVHQESIDQNQFGPIVATPDYASTLETFAIRLEAIQGRSDFGKVYTLTSHFVVQVDGIPNRDGTVSSSITSSTKKKIVLDPSTPISDFVVNDVVTVHRGKELGSIQVNYQLFCTEPVIQEKESIGDYDK